MEELILNTDAGADSGLRCPECQYNLTGLVAPRCPECGAAFDWEDVRRTAANPIRIRHEKARGWDHVPAFFVTWATVLFTPWIFARQAVGRISVKLGLIFGILCFVPMTIRYIFEGVDPSYFAWISAAAVYVVAQSLLMVLLDPHGWRKPKETVLFWLAIGGYTSAIVVTECIYPAPLLSAGELWEFYSDLFAGKVGLTELYNLVESPWTLFGWLQVIIWLIGLALCYAARLRAAGVSKGKRILASAFGVFLLINLYALCIDPIGTTFFEWFGGSSW